ncbi:MAG: MFS transporter [Gammaproteobacteria bacterium]|nr:MFS transporter [Gammaproteobacteria bacterium]
MSDSATHRRQLIALCGTYAGLHFNRQLPAILAQSIKHSFALRDAQLGTLTGSAFALVFALLGLYFGTLADRRNRVTMVRVGALLWSLAALGAALANGFATLLLTRAAVAIGEAVATAAAVSLIGEWASAAGFGRVAGALFASAYLGAGAAAIVGGSVLAWASAHAIPDGWRLAMGVAAVPGLLASVFITGPSRTGDSSQRRASDGGDPLSPVTVRILWVAAAVVVALPIRLPTRWSVPLAVGVGTAAGIRWIADLRRNDPPAFRATFGAMLFWHWVIAFAAVLFVDYAASYWLFPFAARRFHVDPGTNGRDLGGILVIGGICGALLGGAVADRWRRRRAAAYAWTALAAVATEAVAIGWSVHQTTFTAFLRPFAIFCIAGGAWTGLAAAIGLDLIPSAHRGTGAAAYFFTTTLFGPGLGPFVVGMLSDRWGSLSAALDASALVMGIAVVLLWQLGRRFETATATASSSSIGTPRDAQ